MAHDDSGDEETGDVLGYHDNGVKRLVNTELALERENESGDLYSIMSPVVFNRDWEGEDNVADTHDGITIHHHEDEIKGILILPFIFTTSPPSSSKPSHHMQALLSQTTG